MDDRELDLIHRARKRLENPYAYVGEDGKFEADFSGPTEATQSAMRRLENPYAYVGNDEHETAFSDPAETNRVPQLDIAELRGMKKPRNRWRRDEIEAIARRLHLAVWDARGGRKDANPLDSADPLIALPHLGFEPVEDATLGEMDHDGVVVAVAGLLDRDRSQVRYSPRFPRELQRFTLAHEVGHIILHAGTGLHRDRALDPNRSNPPLSPQEREADMFAAAFLMPTKHVSAEFNRRFSTARFMLDETTAFGLGDGKPRNSAGRTSQVGGLAARLARATHFHGFHFRSMAEHFGVSPATMTIRLRELELVEEGF
jgi:hypothetical protein